MSSYPRVAIALNATLCDRCQTVTSTLSSIGGVIVIIELVTTFYIYSIPVYRQELYPEELEQPLLHLLLVLNCPKRFANYSPEERQHFD